MTPRWPSLVRQVDQALRRFGADQAPTVVAVSGGPDSVALLRAMVDRGAGRTTPMLVAHLHHGLRGQEAERDLEFVQNLAASLTAVAPKILVRVERLDVPGIAAAARENVEAAARRVRYQWLTHVAQEANIPWVMTGHNANDQAETVLHRLLRGTGLQGLRGIAPQRSLSPEVTLVRPLLTVSRSDILAYLDSLGQGTCLDSTNLDPSLTRNRLRAELLPLLMREYNPRVVELLSRLAAQAEESFEVQDALARRLLAESERPQAGTRWVFARAVLSQAPRPVVRTMFRLLWEREGWSMAAMGYSAWDRLAAVAHGAIPGLDLPGGIRVRLREQVLHVERRPLSRLVAPPVAGDNASMNAITLRRALLSVSDKTGLVDLARALAGFGVELISTGGTRKVLAEAGLTVRDISEVTGFPEMLDGRVKTLHPKIHAGLLALRDNTQHAATLAEHGIGWIDLVVCNLYPFEATLAKTGSTHEDIVENIDIGGPSMVRSASKNYHDVAVVTSPEQYPAILEELRASGGSLTLATRERLAAAAFALTAAYDRAIAAYFAARVQVEKASERLELVYERRQTLRYGENPHQSAAFYAEPGVRHPCVATAKTLHGKELSYNNILDLDSAFNLVREFSDPAAVVIKHNNPCGAAIAGTLEEAFRKAYDGDPLSAYGGVLAFNREVDEATALQISEPKRFIECIIAPSFHEAAFTVLTTRPSWKNSVRLLATGPLTEDSALRTRDLRRVDGGLLVQGRDLRGGEDLDNPQVVTQRAPTAQEMTDLRFAWLVCKHVKSNAIVLARDGRVVGVGAGQMSRVDSVHLAVRKSGERHKGSVMASDAFFPFRDNIEEAARAGVTAIAQPGGSMRDADSIAACDEQGLAMVFTGTRHFRH